MDSQDDGLLTLPVDDYVGLTLAEAEAKAQGEGRCVRVLESLAGDRRADLMPSRVNVELDSAGVIVGADAG